MEKLGVVRKFNVVNLSDHAQLLTTLSFMHMTIRVLLILAFAYGLTLVGPYQGKR